MRVDFRCAHAGVSEHLLYGEQVGAAFEQVCGKAMPERVWTDGLCDAVFLSQVFHDEENHLSREACSTAVEENRVSEFRFYVDVQPSAFDVLIEDFQARISYGHQSFFAALAEDAQETVVFIYIADLQVGEF